MQPTVLQLLHVGKGFLKLAGELFKKQKADSTKKASSLKIKDNWLQ